MNLPAEHPIRRHADGSIDIRHYARKAEAERREASAECLALVAAAMRRMATATQSLAAAPKRL